MNKPNELNINIEYLREYQQKKNLSNKELAELIGIHESTISRILRNEKGVGFKFIIGVFHHLEGIELIKLFPTVDRKKEEKI